MKRCPECNRTYADETLAFCLADGALLSAPFDPQATQRLPSPRSTNEVPTEVLPGAQPHPLPSPRPNSSKLIYVAVALIALLIVGGMAMLLRSELQKRNSMIASATPSPNNLPVSSPAPSSSVAKPTAKAEATPSPTVDDKIDVSQIAGTYSLYRLQDPSGDALGKMTITVRGGSNIFVRGADWKGAGKMTDRKQGYYDWEFEDGKNGRTTILINDDGTLQGRVFGSGLDWWYLARRQN